MGIVVHLHNQLVLLTLQFKRKRVLKIRTLFLGRFFRGRWGFLLAAEWKYFDQIWDLFGFAKLKVLYHRACFYAVWQMILIRFFGRGAKLILLFSFNQHDPRERQLYILVERNQVPFQFTLNLYYNPRHWKKVYSMIIYLNSSDTAQ